MEKIILYIKIASSVIMSGISYFLGGFDVLFICLLSLVVIDYISGVLAALCNKTLSSRTGFIGIIKKVCIFLVVAVATMIGMFTGIDGIRDLTVSFYIANESVSVLENLGNIGVPLPQKLKDVLLQIREEKV
ncbi:MAG: phage holin family protein [Clostridia bacterium]|nr:phage holin family protein [Clostridia bacterium]